MYDRVEKRYKSINNLNNSQKLWKVIQRLTILNPVKIESIISTKIILRNEKR